MAAKKKTSTTKTPAKAAARKGTTFAMLAEQVELPADACGRGRCVRGLAVSPAAAAVLDCGFPGGFFAYDAPVAPKPNVNKFMLAYGQGGFVPRGALPTVYAIAAAAPADLAKAHANPPPMPSLEKAMTHALHYGDAIELYAIEAHYGAEAVLDAVVTAFAEKHDRKWKHAHRQYRYLTFGLRSLQWRVSKAARDRMRQRLLARWELDDDCSAELDVLLNGRAGVERSGDRFGNQPNGPIDSSDLAQAHDDPQWALDQWLARLKILKPADRVKVHPQLLVLCGPKAVAATRANFARFRSADKKKNEAYLSLFA